MSHYWRVHFVFSHRNTLKHATIMIDYGGTPHRSHPLTAKSDLHELAWLPPWAHCIQGLGGPIDDSLRWPLHMPHAPQLKSSPMVWPNCFHSPVRWLPNQSHEPQHACVQWTNHVAATQASFYDRHGAIWALSKRGKIFLNKERKQRIKNRHQ